jgi:MoaA/NifB/PqqE/SkfB family radical SAM enzyme
VENLRALSQEAGRGRPALSIQCTLHRGGEGAVLRLVELAGELGVPRVNLARLDLRLAPGLRRPSYDEEAALFARAERLGRERGVQVDLLPHGMLSGLRRLAYKGVRRALHRLDSHCFKPYDHLYVNVDGVVTPCCGLPLLSLGDVREASILDVWNGEAMARFRRDQNRVCGRCDVARIRQRA